MSSLVGVRVVRGPDWTWGDQDGGEGCAGTIIATSDSDMKLFGPRMVTVSWDTGMKACYQGSPEGNYNSLRIVNNAAIGVHHPNIPCGNDLCWVQEIQGIRWQCVTCNINLCTSCFMHKIPHNGDHNKFKRYDYDRVKSPPIVSCWIGDGPESRIELKGIYPGANVSLEPEWPYGRENEMKSGVVIAAPKEEISGRDFVVEWLASKERTRFQRGNTGGILVLRLKDEGMAGYYNPCALPIAFDIPISVAESAPCQQTFSIGDRVQIDPAITSKELEVKQKGFGGYIDTMDKYIGVTGTVYYIVKTKVFLKFRDLAMLWSFNPTILRKLNTFSVNQFARIRSDPITVMQMKKKGEPDERYEKVTGAICRVTHIDEENPDKLFVLFNDESHYKWVSRHCPLPSDWMEEYTPESARSALKEEVTELVAKGIDLLFHAVDEGDVDTIKELDKHYRIDFDAWKRDGMTALQLACEKNHKELVKWFINEAKVGLDVNGIQCFRAIHYAVQRGRTEILKLLIEKGADVNVQTDCGKTALHFSVSNQFTDCSRLLIDAGCDANLQDSDGNTPLHLALLNRSPICVNQILSKLWINFELHNKMGFNVLHLAVVMDDLRAIELMMDEERVRVPLLELMPNSQSTVLHYACFYRNFKVAEMLLRKSPKDGSSAIPAGLLESKTKLRRTAFLVSCLQKDHALIELLVDAGTDVKAADLDENTAISLIASSRTKDEIPTKEISPGIFKVYQNIMEDPEMQLIGNLPILSLIVYLMTKGCCLEPTNKNGKTALDVLISKGFPHNITEILTRFVAKNQQNKEKSDCMGRSGCALPPVFQLTCPHKPPFKACSDCFPLTFKKQKCGCPEEDVASIPVVNPSGAKQNNCQQIKTERAVEIEVTNETNDLLWINEGSKNGFVADKSGNKFTWSGTRKDGGIGYRCTTEAPLEKQGRCTAVARRIVDKETGASTILLESPHKHPPGKRTRPDDNNANDSGPPASKRGRVSAGDMDLD